MGYLGTGIHVRRTRGTERGELESGTYNSALRWALPFVLFKFLVVGSPRAAASSINAVCRDVRCAVSVAAVCRAAAAG